MFSSYCIYIVCLHVTLALGLVYAGYQSKENVQQNAGYCNHFYGGYMGSPFRAIKKHTHNQEVCVNVTGTFYLCL